MAVVVVGESLVDLAPRDGLLAPLPGGAPANVAVGLARLGRATSYLGSLSVDALGDLLVTRLRTAGVDLGLSPRVDAPTTLAVLELDADGRAMYRFYLDGTSAMAFTAPESEALPPDAALHLSFGAIGIAHEPAGHAFAALLRQERGRRLTSLDPNIRPSVFEAAGDRPAYLEQLTDLVGAVDLVKVSDEDLATLAPTRPDPLDLAREWAADGPSLVVVTLGPSGAVAFRRDDDSGALEEVRVAGEVVEVVDTVGAGDAFASGMLAALDAAAVTDAHALERLPAHTLESVLQVAVHVASVTCTRRGSDPPMLRDLALDRRP